MHAVYMGDVLIDLRCSYTPTSYNPGPSSHDYAKIIVG